MAISDEERIVRSAFAAAAQLPKDAIANIGDNRTLMLLSAATTAAILRKYPSLPDTPRIRDFVEVLQARFPDAAHVIKPIVVEALIRFAFGDLEIINGIEPNDLQTAVFFLPYAIVSEEYISGEPLDELVAEVLKSVDEEH